MQNARVLQAAVLLFAGFWMLALTNIAIGQFAHYRVAPEVGTCLLICELICVGLVHVLALVRRLWIASWNNLSKRHLADQSAGHLGANQQLRVDALYRSCFGGLIALVATLACIPHGPGDLLFKALGECFNDANLAAGAIPEFAGPGKLLLAFYLLWWWLPAMSGLSSWFTRLVLRSVNGSPSTHSVGEAVLNMVRSNINLPVRVPRAFARNCLLSCIWISTCLAGWIAVMWFHPTPAGSALTHMLEPWGRTVPGHWQMVQYPNPAAQASLPHSNRSGMIHPHYHHYPARSSIHNYAAADPNTPVKLFLACLTALWVCPSLAITGCVWLPFRRQPKLVLCSEGLLLPSLFSPLWLRPLRIWKNLQSAAVRGTNVLITFHDQSRLTIPISCLQSADWKRFVAELRAHAPGADIADVTDLASAASESTPLTSSPPENRFAINNFQFAMDYFRQQNLGRRILLAVPLAMVLLFEQCMLLLATHDRASQFSISAVCRTILKHIISPVKHYAKLMYASTFVVPILITFLPKFMLLPLIAVCLCGIALYALAGRFPSGVAQPCDRLGAYLRECLTSFRPFLLWGLYISGVAGILLMVSDAVAKALKRSSTSGQPADDGSLVLTQNRASDPDMADYNFYHSTAFPITLAAIYVLGVPAAAAFYCFWWAQPQDYWMQHLWTAPGTNALLFVYSYVAGLGCMLSALFFRAWFGLLAANASTEYDIIIDSLGAKQGNVKGWFADFLFYGWHEFFPREMHWSSVIAVDYEEKGFGTLTPLPNAIFPKSSRIHRLLSNMAALTDAYTETHGRVRNIVLRTSYDKKFGHGLRIRLQDLDASQSEQLLQSLLRWATNAEFDDRVFAALSS